MEIVPTSPILRFALDHWRAVAESVGGLPRRDDIDIFDLKPCLGHMLLLDIAEPIEDSRYRVFGTMLVEYFNEELTGERLGDTGGAKNGVLIAEYRQVLRRAEPLMFSNDPVIGGSVFLYEKVALPLRGEDGGVGHILAVIDQLPAL
jgi:hypothetical protein